MRHAASLPGVRPLDFLIPDPSVPRFTALTIAGSDSGGGAGLQADLKAFEANGVFGMSVVTALTAQNTHGVAGVHTVPPAFVTAQLDAVVADLPVGAVKTGMLATADVVETVASGIAHHALGPVVVDPVMVATSGDLLLAPEAVEAVRARMLPLADLLTPNAHEAAALAGVEVHTLADARRAADRLLADGPAAVLIKGGHLESEAEAVDLLALASGEAFVYRQPRLDTRHTHGTGCTLASAVAAHLARGRSLPEAIGHARAYLQGALAHAPGLGGGHGPVGHFWFVPDSPAPPVEPKPWT